MRDVIIETAKEIYEGLAKDARDKLYPEQEKSMAVVFGELAKVFYPDTHPMHLTPSQIHFMNGFHIDVFSRRIMTRMATGWSLEDSTASIFGKYTFLSYGIVRQAIDVSMTFLNRQFPQVDNRDKEISKLASMSDKIAGVSKKATSNEGITRMHINDPDYGLCPNKPVFTAGFEGERAYVGRLATADGRGIKFERTGSKEVEGIHGPVDIFKLTDPDGRETTIYVSVYASTTSDIAPMGFSLRGNTQASHTPIEPQQTVSMKSPSPGIVKELISAYQQAATQEERQSIVMPLLFNLCNIPLTFLVLYEVVQKPASEFRNGPFGSIAKIPEDAATVPMAKRIIRPLEFEHSQKIVPVFTDFDAYNRSEYPRYLNKMFMEAYECLPEKYLPLLKDLQYEGVLLNPGTQNHFFPKDFFEMFMAKGIEG